MSAVDIVTVNSATAELLSQHRTSSFTIHSRNDSLHQSRRKTRSQLPHGSWDSHMHITDPKNYPLDVNATYIPPSHLLEEALDQEKMLGIDNIVLVQPSIYGNDNSCLLGALRKLGPTRSRAVVAFDPSTIEVQTLKLWHEQGVRGVRVNFQSVGRQVGEKELEALLWSYADLLRPLGWVLQLYMPLSTMTVLERIVPGLGVRVCMDHFGNPSENMSKAQENDPHLIPGFTSLIRLLEQGNTYVKISAPYRLCNEPTVLRKMFRTLSSCAQGHRVVFGTDWPHTRYSGLDITPFLDLILRWCGNDQVLVNNLFRDNAMRLWDVV